MVAPALKKNRSVIIPMFKASRNSSSCTFATLGSSSLDSSISSHGKAPTRKSCLKRPNSSSSVRKSVSFQSISIREHARAVDINPSVSAGPALGLSWTYEDLPTFTFDQYESCRPPRRDRNEFQVPLKVREAMLREHGVTRSEILAAVKDTNILRQRRRASVAAQEMEGAHRAMEWTVRRMKKMVGAKKNYDQEEAKLWEKAQKNAGIGVAIPSSVSVTAAPVEVEAEC